MAAAIIKNQQTTNPINPLTVRRAALDILNRLDQDQRTLDIILDEVHAKKQFPAKRDRALLQTLVFGVLRWRGRLDYVLGTFSRTPLKKIDPPVRNILRLGLFQILYLSRIPQSAAVNTAVELAKKTAPPWVVRFVNGVLRTAAREHENIKFPDIDQNPVAAISTRKSFPEWYVRRRVNAVGCDETIALCDAINKIPDITLRTNTLRTDREILLKSLTDSAEGVAATAVAPDGITLTNPKKSIPQIEAFKRGWFQVQDEAAQLISLLTAPHPGESVLDACAGLGGKTGHMAQLMRNSGSITAVDTSSDKLGQLVRQMQRMGVSIVDTRTVDLTKPSDVIKLGRFDKILLDAPCTGLGVLRRNPDAKWKVRESMINQAARKQAELIHNLATLVNPGGYLVYAVCSTEPEENEAVAESFLEIHPEFTTADPREYLHSAVVSLIGRDGSLKTLPHRHNMDGFFGQVFKRIQ
jgi:16S rRNA (cytosine967-C5)-methyltransferase